MTCQEARVAPDSDRVVPVRVIAADAATRAAVTTGLRRQPGIALTASAGRPTARVVVVVATTIDDAVALFRQAYRLAGARLIVIAGTLTPAAVFKAVRAGACAILPRAATGPADVAAAVHAAATGDGTMPRDMCERVLELATEPAAHQAAGTTGTVSDRELHVLRLVADGYGNAEIAQRLDLSQHTVKNVIYDLLARLRLRNRTHAVAYAVRAGLI